MMVRLSTVEKGRYFIYNGKTYVMGSVKTDNNGSRFRWVQNAETGKWSKFTVHGAKMVTLVKGAPKVKGTDASQAAATVGRRVVRRPVQKDKTHRTTGTTRTKVAKVLVSTGANTYRVTATWWVSKKKFTKEFRVNADSAGSALKKVPAPANSNFRITYTVAKVSE